MNNQLTKKNPFGGDSLDAGLSLKKPERKAPSSEGILKQIDKQLTKRESVREKILKKCGCL